MKTIISTLALTLLFLNPVKGEEIAIPETAETQPAPQSFAYGRVGAFVFVPFPFPGVEAAIGYRYRTERWGTGPLLNVSGPFLPTISLKCEILYYPKSWGQWYWGFMPGIGYNTFQIHQKRNNRGSVFPSLELVFGKEFVNLNNKKRFYYFSISPYFLISYNYGWSF